MIYLIICCYVVERPSLWRQEVVRTHHSPCKYVVPHHITVQLGYQWRESFCTSSPMSYCTASLLSKQGCRTFPCGKKTLQSTPIGLTALPLSAQGRGTLPCGCTPLTSPSRCHRASPVSTQGYSTSPSGCVTLAYQIYYVI